MKTLLPAFVSLAFISMFFGCTEWNNPEITIKATNMPLPKFLDTLEKLAPMTYYIDTAIAEKHLRPVSLSVSRSSLADVMSQVSQQEPDLFISATQLANIPFPLIRISEKSIKQN